MLVLALTPPRRLKKEYMISSRILVIDDEAKIREIVCSYLEHTGHTVFQAGTGRAGLAVWTECRPELLVLDLMLPDITGEEVCRTIRRSSDLPVLMLTAKAEASSLLHGFNSGADDYLTKPFSPRELVVRVQALLKRAGARADAKNAGTAFFANPDDKAGRRLFLNSPDQTLQLDANTCRFTKRQVEITLTATEFRLMETFLAYPRRVFSRLDLVRIALGDDYVGSERTIDAHIKNLRNKIEDDPRHPKWIQTVFGFGYQLVGSLSVTEIESSQPLTKASHR